MNKNPSLTNYDVAMKFIEGKNAKTKSMRSHAGILYSYKEPIAYIDPENKGVWVNIERYTHTTAKHISDLKSALNYYNVYPLQKWLLFDSAWFYPDRAEFQLWQYKV